MPPAPYGDQQQARGGPHPAPGRADPVGPQRPGRRQQHRQRQRGDHDVVDAMPGSGDRAMASGPIWASGASAYRCSPCGDHNTSAASRASRRSGWVNQRHRHRVGHDQQRGRTRQHHRRTPTTKHVSPPKSDRRVADVSTDSRSRADPSPALATPGARAAGQPGSQCLPPCPVRPGVVAESVSRGVGTAEGCARPRGARSPREGSSSPGSGRPARRRRRDRPRRGNPWPRATSSGYANRSTSGRRHSSLSHRGAEA